ncbi:MAG: VCBS repeat-containing protein, partial [Fimbriimonadaceae bacterium]|nr:VCBS repeat-containing protein [Chitinophagales bacterium]
MKKQLIVIFILLLSGNIFSQYVLNNTIPFTSDGITLLNPSCGGFNAPQFSYIDINLDGKQDIFVFDRAGNKFSVFINETTGTEPKFVFTNIYDPIFPTLKDWAMMRDYNCDGLQDIFTYYSGSTAVYKAINDGGVLSFELEKEQISYVNDFEIPIYTSRSDIPDFTDVNNDGDIDVLSFGVTGTTMRYFENTSIESFWECDSLQFDLIDYCWGEINEG